MYRNKGKDFPGTGGRSGDGRSLTDPRTLEGYFNLQSLPSVAKELVHPGKDPKELLMRCIIKDERLANAVVLYYAKCIEFGLKEELEVLAHWLASRVSIGGLGRRELVMTATGIISPQLWPGVRDGKKKFKFGRKREEETEQGE